MHGYAIANFVRGQTNDAISIESAALYQALHRLETKKLVRGSWGLSDTNRRAKFYELTAAGKKSLREQSIDLKAYVAALFAVLDAK
jgi:DNA-binding PadR family transcriptional regulator